MRKIPQNFEEFLVAYERFAKAKRKEYPDSHLRDGQLLMNYISIVWPKKYPDLVNTEFDCYYKDEVMPKTLDHLGVIWNEFEKIYKENK